MRIGILTFHRASNYGAVLQAYALTEVLRQWQPETEIVDYRCPEVELSHQPMMLFRRQSFPQACLHFYTKHRKFKLFEGFRRRRLHLSQTYTPETVAEASKVYDVFIAGSDQIWSDKFSGMDLTYLLDFEKDPQKKYSYAASFGFTEFPAGKRDVYAEHLREFQGVSVREQSAAELLQRECGIDAFMSLDPTLILSPEKWQQAAEKPAEEKPYILVYTVQAAEHLIDYAKRLSQETGLEIVYLNSNHNSHRELRHARFAAPEQFVGWFANAAYVLTNSFHGTAFSVIFRRRLAVEIRTKQSLNTRSRDLLRLCGLESSILGDDWKGYQIPEPDWTAAGERLAAEQERSLAYLRKICGA